MENPYGARAMGVEPPASGGAKMAAAGIPMAVAMVVGGAFLFLMLLRTSFRNAVVK